MSGDQWLDGYEPVEDRLRAFWADHPNGRITTGIEEYGLEGWVVKAWIYRDAGDADAAATGLAHENIPGGTPFTRGSELEVCETSAIGRALANLGYAKAGARPSLEEMVKVSGEAVPSLAADPDGAEVTDTGKVRADASGTGGAADRPSGSTKIYPLDPRDCDHKLPSGRWIPWDPDDRCPRCGTPKVSAVEGTTVDLGSATGGYA